ncbi:MAG: hypothetical protein K9H48_07730 [Melioribacteraceae bacterium]|nr:hypothetical protein [Melioribacteraceae bacterium]
MTQVTMYTDGCALGNPGPGGSAVVLLSGNHRKEISKGFPYTTNNKAELSAVILGLENLKYSCDITIYTNSEHVARGINKWTSFNKNTKKHEIQKKGIANRDLWDKYLELANKQKTIKAIWVKAHAGNKENEKVDKLAKKEAYEQRK